MATTGFWPVKGGLKKVLDYADNPKKTTALPDPEAGLAQALAYTADVAKTDRLMYVHALNTIPEQAYEDMMATKRRFGKLGGNIAYHGFQSFKTGEISPEEAHQIGIETAQRLWGKDYEVLITTHLNTENIHNHFVLNSVSFRNGKKFLNKKSDHYRLREISDEICLAHQKSVLKDAPFYGGGGRDYWARKSGQPTHREILKKDVEEALRTAVTTQIFLSNLKKLGYTVVRDRNHAHLSVKAPGWERAVRLDKLGYTNDVLNQRIEDNLFHDEVYWEYHREYGQKPDRPLLYILSSSPKLQSEWPLSVSRHGIRQLILAESAVAVTKLILVLLVMMTGRDGEWLEKFLGLPEKALKEKQRPLSPEMRQELTKLNQYDAQTRLLAVENIRTDEDLDSFLDNTSFEIETLEQQRRSLRNKERRTDEPEKKVLLRAEIRAISLEIAPLRKKKLLAEEIRKRSRERLELLRKELTAELPEPVRDRDRGDVR